MNFLLDYIPFTFPIPHADMSFNKTSLLPKNINNFLIYLLKYEYIFIFLSRFIPIFLIGFTLSILIFPVIILLIRNLCYSYRCFKYSYFSKNYLPYISTCTSPSTLHYKKLLKGYSINLSLFGKKTDIIKEKKRIELLQMIKFNKKINSRQKIIHYFDSKNDYLYIENYNFFYHLIKNYSHQLEPANAYLNFSFMKNFLDDKHNKKLTNQAKLSRKINSIKDCFQSATLTKFEEKFYFLLNSFVNNLFVYLQEKNDEQEKNHYKKQQPIFIQENLHRLMLEIFFSINLDLDHYQFFHKYEELDKLNGFYEGNSDGETYDTLNYCEIFSIINKNMNDFINYDLDCESRKFSYFLDFLDDIVLKMIEIKYYYGAISPDSLSFKLFEYYLGEGKGTRTKKLGKKKTFDKHFGEKMKMEDIRGLKAIYNDLAKNKFAKADKHKKIFKRLNGKNRQLFLKDIFTLLLNSYKTSFTIAWFLFSISMHENVQERCFKACILESFKLNRTNSMKEEMKLGENAMSCTELVLPEYMEATLKESMRLYPVVTDLYRKHKKGSHSIQFPAADYIKEQYEFKLKEESKGKKIEESNFNYYSYPNNILLPDDIIYHISLLSIHYNTSLWGKNALKFEPERFMKQEKNLPYLYNTKKIHSKKKDIKNKKEDNLAKLNKIDMRIEELDHNDLKFLPFGVNLEMLPCLGVNLSVWELRNILLALVENFEFKLGYTKKKMLMKKSKNLKENEDELSVIDFIIREEDDTDNLRNTLDNFEEIIIRNYEEEELDFDEEDPNRINIDQNRSEDEIRKKRRARETILNKNCMYMEDGYFMHPKFDLPLLLSLRSLTI